MPEKRPYEGDGPDSASKRVHSSSASPILSNGASGAKKSIQEQIAEAKAKAEAFKARLAAAKGGAASPAPPVATPSPPTDDAAARRARVEALRAKVKAATEKPVMQQKQPVFQPPQQHEDTYDKARGGLGIGLHPALMGDSGQNDRNKGRQAMQPKFATTMANRRTESPVPDIDKKGNKKQQHQNQLDLSAPTLEELKQNPYFDVSLSRPSDTKTRHSRQLIFNQKGKYINQANALRRQAALEAMKKRIASQARKVGLDEDNEKVFLVPAPPDIEWWDEGLLVDKNYDHIDEPGHMKIDTDDTIITIYIQHPVQLQPPQEKNAPAPKAMFLTTTEQKKLRRQRRMAEHKEQQAKIRLGLEPPPPPKVKKSNLMRVLGEQAVKDPTAVEARVNREIAERAEKHHEANETRKLTKEQQHEKLAAQQAADAAKGVQVSVYRVENLSYGKHRYQIDINAKQNGLTGVCILHPRMNIVIVEGGAHSISAYRKLMLNRIKWTENAMPSSVREGNREAEQAWLRSVDEQNQLKDLSFNKCELVWEGQERQRKFRKWVGVKVCESDGEAREALKRSGMDNMWTLAKSLGESTT